VRYQQREDTRMVSRMDTGMGVTVESVRAGGGKGGVLCVSGGGKDGGGRVKVYRSENGELLEEVEGVGGKWGIGGMEVREDGKRMVTFGVGSKSVEIWKLPQPG